MEKLLDVNYNYVSLTSFEKFVKEELPKVGNEFTKEDLLVGKQIPTRLPKVRNLLKFSLILGIISKPNGVYHKNQQQEWKDYSNKLEQNIKFSRQLLANIIYSLEEFKEVIIFLKNEGVSRRDFIEFLMNKDSHQWRESHYKLTAMSISNMLFELGLIRRIKTRGGRIKRNVLSSPLSSFVKVEVKTIVAENTRFDKQDIELIKELHNKYGKENVAWLNENII